MSLVNVVKWEANTSELVHKSAIEDLRLGSQLVVYPSQTAFFVKGGQIFDEFSAGTYTIKSENIPLLNKVFNMPFGGQSPFQAEVWFVNRISLLDCKWGTATPIQIEDPKYGVIVPIRSYGQYGFHISDPRLFLERLIGNMPTFTAEKVTNYFRGVIMSKLTALISKKLYADSLSVINVNSHVEEISEYAKAGLAEVFAAYGVELEMFSVISISVNEDDPSFRKLKDTKDSLARIEIMGSENYKMERTFDVLDTAAGNEGGGMVGSAVGIGAGIGVGTQIGNMAKEYLNPNTACPPCPPCPPPVPAQTSYYLGINGQQQGPYGYDAVKNMVASRQLTADTLIWKPGMANWDKIGNVSDFSGLFNNCPPPFPTA